MPLYKENNHFCQEFFTELKEDHGYMIIVAKNYKNHIISEFKYRQITKNILILKEY